MPITKAAQKSLRQNTRRRKENLLRKKRIKKVYKEIIGLAKEKKLDKAKTQLGQYYKAVDKAVKTKVLKKNTARRKKSRLSTWLNQLTQSSVKKR